MDNSLFEKMAGTLFNLLEEYDYWCIGLMFEKYNEDGSKRYIPRPDFSWEDILSNRAKMPRSGSIEDLKRAIIEKKGYI